VNTVFVPSARFPRWVVNFAEGHGGATYAVTDGALRGQASDRSWFAARLPFGAAYTGEPDASAFAAAAVSAVPADWGVLLVRKGGFAVARLGGTTLGESKTGQRHVQGRTKAGGQSQQRFARRRDNQARQAYDAAAGHAERILAGLTGPVVVGGDRAAIEAVLEGPGLRSLDVRGPWLAVPDPRRSVLEEAIRTAIACQIDVVNA
jgi:hypothetical protein